MWVLDQTTREPNGQAWRSWLWCCVGAPVTPYGLPPSSTIERMPVFWLPNNGETLKLIVPGEEPWDPPECVLGYHHAGPSYRETYARAMTLQARRMEAAARWIGTEINPRRLRTLGELFEGVLDQPRAAERRAVNRTPKVPERPLRRRRMAADDD